jgi:hypothetical protein
MQRVIVPRRCCAKKTLGLLKGSHVHTFHERFCSSEGKMFVVEAAAAAVRGRARRRRRSPPSTRTILGPPIPRLLSFTVFTVTPAPTA